MEAHVLSSENQWRVPVGFFQHYDSMPRLTLKHSGKKKTPVVATLVLKG